MQAEERLFDVQVNVCTRRTDGMQARPHWRTGKYCDRAFDARWSVVKHMRARACRWGATDSARVAELQTWGRRALSLAGAFGSYRIEPLSLAQAVANAAAVGQQGSWLDSALCPA